MAVTSERLQVSSFLAIKKCDLTLKELTVLIGPQASGKSILAKIAFFCRNYIRDAFTEFAVSTEDKRQFNKSKADEFYELFPGAEVPDHRFSIEYSINEYVLIISKSKGNRSLKLAMGDIFEKQIGRARRDYAAFLSTRKERSSRFLYDGWYAFIRENEHYQQLNTTLPRVLHIPATRAFFSAVKRNFFTFLSESKTLDPLMVQFGRFLEYAKSEYTGDDPFKASNVPPTRSSELEGVISGQYIREKDEDFIRTDWGKVSLQSSSSGQQEALPLMLALLHYPNERWANDLIIIEEPEAHLFPSAQKAILEMIVGVVAKKNCNVLVTTHSPYILACVNNELQKKSPYGRDRPVQAGCYFVESGELLDMYDYSDNLIDMSKLDAVSDEIASDFVKIIGESGSENE